MSIRHLSFLVAALIAAISSRPASAQDVEPAPEELEARRLFEQGREAYERELFTEAEDSFVAAYEAMPVQNERRPLILLNVAQAIERQGGRDEDALAAWRRFEAEARSVADDSVLLRASERIRELEARLERRHHDEPDPDPEVLEAPAEGDTSPHWAGLVVTGIGGAMVVAGAVVGALGLARKNDVLDRCEGTSCPADARSDADSLDGLALGADLLLWPGLAIAAAGVVMIFTLRTDDDPTEPSVSVGCGLGGCTLGGRF